MNTILKRHFELLSESNRIGHAFLICNTCYENLKEDIFDILSNYFFDTKINIDECSDVYIIKPQNGKILKEDILSLQEAFKTYSQINKNRVYIIDGAECMNDYASNALLKTLEEPENGIFAFLISSNINKVLPTIKSRCQILLVDDYSGFDLSKYDSDFVKNVISFIEKLEKEKVRTLAYIYDFFSKKEEKENMENVVKIMKYFYRDVFLHKLGKNLEYFNDYSEIISKIDSKNTEKSIINKLTILNRYESMLEYNLNLGLFLDKLIMEMGSDNL